MRLALCPKGFATSLRTGKPNKKREFSLQEVVGASSQAAAGKPATLREGASGLSSLVPRVQTGCADPGQAGGCPDRELGCSDSPAPRPGAEGPEVLLQAPSLLTTVQQPALVMFFSSSPSTVVCASALLLPPAQAAHVWVQLDGPQDVAGPAA